jgi:predicted nucleic acid-binding protein
LILADTSVWVDHLRDGDDRLAIELNAAEVLTHPFVIGELAVGNLRQRDVILRELDRLPKAAVATPAEVLALIAREGLHGLGLGYIDVALLAAARLTPGAQLWTRDRRLRDAAIRLGVAAA